jgi:hypothetical protein
VISFTSRPLCPRYPLNKRLVDPRTGLDDMENIKFLTLRGLEIRPSSP